MLMLLTQFLVAVYNYAASGLDSRSKQQYKQCLEVCSACDRFDKRGICLECFCIVALKAKMKTENCPLGKWLA